MEIRILPWLHSALIAALFLICPAYAMEQENNWYSYVVRWDDDTYNIYDFTEEMNESAIVPSEPCSMGIRYGTIICEATENNIKCLRQERKCINDISQSNSPRASYSRRAMNILWPRKQFKSLSEKLDAYLYGLLKKYYIL